MEHSHNDAAGGSQASVKSYLIGFVLSVILTVIPFGLVMSGTWSKTAILIGISLAALVQIVVQLYFFLHLDSSPNQRWNLLTLVLTAIIVVLLVGGSLWIMYNLNVRMMDHGHITPHMHH